MSTESRMWSPMLAAEYAIGGWDYAKRGALIASPKLNGVRACNQGGKLYARSLKPIRNQHTSALFSGIALGDCEGELIVGEFNDPDVFVKSTSGIMTTGGTPDVSWNLFDMYHPTAPYSLRLELLAARFQNLDHPNVKLIPWKIVRSDTEMEAYADKSVREGYEGLVLRADDAPYKQSRSTSLEGGFLRFCQWHRAEATILNVIEGKVNLNESKANELGFLHKSAHKANKVGSGQAGSVLVQDEKTGIIFSIPTTTEAMEADIWNNQDKYVGQLLKYKFKPPVKKGGAPRFPQWEGLRHPDDAS